MVDCPRTDIRDALPDLIHDQLEPLARARVERHVAECAECAAELGLLRSMRSSAFTAPAFDAQRVAAAVHSAMADARESGVVPISSPRVKRPIVQSTRAPRRAAWYDWRAAAGIAAVAVGIAGYALSHGTAPAPVPVIGSSGATAPAPAAVASKASVTSDAAGSANISASSTLLLGDGVSDLSESDMQTLLQAVDDLEAMPDLEPYPLPLLARVVEGAL